MKMINKILNSKLFAGALLAMALIAPIKSHAIGGCGLVWYPDWRSWPSTWNSGFTTLVVSNSYSHDTYTVGYGSPGPYTIIQGDILQFRLAIPLDSCDWSPVPIGYTQWTHCISTPPYAVTDNPIPVQIPGHSYIAHVPAITTCLCPQYPGIGKWGAWVQDMTCN